MESTNKSITLIIPVYNTLEKYLLRCFESVRVQKYAKLEVVVVDDGSRSDIANLCECFAKEDDRVRVIHQQNKGLSAARNIAMKQSTGEYIAFLDSDDYLSATFLEDALSLCLDNDADISILHLEYMNFDAFEEAMQKETKQLRVLSAESAIAESFYQKLYNCNAQGKLYHRSVLEGVEFPVGRLAEDLAVCHLIMSNAKKIVHSNKIGYYYRQNPTSIMHQFNIKRMDGLFFAKKAEDFVAINYPNILKAAECRTFNVAVHLLLALPPEEEIYTACITDIWSEIKRTRLSVIFNSKARFRERVAVLISFFGEAALRKAWSSKFAIKQNGTI